MNPIRHTTVVLAALSGLLIGCSSNEHAGEHGEGGERSGEHEGERRGAHDRDGREHGGEHGSEGGEESGTEYGLEDKYDHTRRGARLILRYDRNDNAFVGTVENTTRSTLERVRVEVHLSNGRELGPTPAKNLAPSEKMNVRLAAESSGFERWSAHPEVGRGEHR